MAWPTRVALGRSRCRRSCSQPYPDLGRHDQGAGHADVLLGTSILRVHNIAATRECVRHMSHPRGGHASLIRRQENSRSVPSRPRCPAGHAREAHVHAAALAVPGLGCGKRPLPGCRGLVLAGEADLTARDTLRAALAAMPADGTGEIHLNGQQHTAGTDGHPPGMCWAALSRLLAIHLDAEEEICYPAIAAARPPGGLPRASAAGHFGIREALAEAQVAVTGSPRWLRALTDAWLAAIRHCRAAEDHLLPALGQATTPQTRGLLGRQWAAFTLARLQDAAEAGAAGLTWPG